MKGWKASGPASMPSESPTILTSTIQGYSPLPFKVDLRHMFPKDTFQFVAPRILNKYPPLTFPEIVAETSGLDCLVQLIRHSHSLCTRHDRIEEESINPILAYAWHDLHPLSGPKELRQVRINAKERLIAQLQVHVPTTMTFEGLCQSKLMNDTLWSSDLWELGREFRMCRVNTEASPTDRATRGARGIIEWDCRKDSSLTLQQAVDERFSSRPSSRRHSVYISTGQPFVRVEYFSHHQDTWSYHEMQTFDLPIFTAEKTDDGSIQTRTRFKKYHLVTVIRMRGPSEPLDYVRTYDGDGPTTYSFTPSRSFDNSEWSPIGQAITLCSSTPSPLAPLSLAPRLGTSHKPSRIVLVAGPGFFNFATGQTSVLLSRMDMSLPGTQHPLDTQRHR